MTFIADSSIHDALNGSPMNKHAQHPHRVALPTTDSLGYCHRNIFPPATRSVQLTLPVG